MKKILILGGSSFQTPIIEYAKSNGNYVITCDYLPDNPGHKLADEYYDISTIEKESVLNLATKLSIDAIVDYSSDPNALTAAYVAEKIGLKGNPYNAVKILSNKSLFRKLLESLKLPVPQNLMFNSTGKLEESLTGFNYPLILKPVDSCGSKGVFKINIFQDILDNFNNTKSFSSKGELIIEEFISGDYNQVHGDAYVHQGKVILFCIGDHHFNKDINNLVPFSTTIPSILPRRHMNKLEEVVQKIITEIGFKEGGINIEARIENEKVYIIEIGSRNGGNHVPKLVKYATGFDFVKEKLDFVLGIPQKLKSKYVINGYHSYLVLHTSKSGILEKMSFSNELETLILESYIYIKSGERVNSFKGSNSAIGVLLVKYQSLKQMHSIIKNYKSHVNVRVR